MTATSKKNSQAGDQFADFELYERKTPSWFSQEPKPYSQVPIEHEPKPVAAQSYFETRETEALESYRRRLDQKIREGQAIYDRPAATGVHAVSRLGPQLRRPTLPVDDLEGRRRLYQSEEAHNQNEFRKPRKQQGLELGKVIALSAIAVLVGAGAGLGLSNFSLIKMKAQSSVAALRAQSAAFLAPAPSVTNVQTAPRETVITKKPVVTATLDVADVRGNLGDMIPLALTAPMGGTVEPFSLQLSGLPSKAYLTAGVKSAQGNWVVKPADLAGLKLVVPQTDAKQFDVEVAAIEDRTGELAAPIKALNVKIENAPQVISVAEPLPSSDAPLPGPAIVRPVNAPPETAMVQTAQPSPIPTPNAKTDDLLAKGDTLLQSGDLISARQFYLKAAELGSAKGSFGVARTFDPKVYAQLNVVGLQPDSAQAASWYQKAAQAGVVDAAP
ncbi:MAG: sel1 repeat family protein [Alphaproteobacteria bacterium]|nr:sel1 repeat family protein [Alphaproteobacteria bacterium]